MAIKSWPYLLSGSLPFNNKKHQDPTKYFTIARVVLFDTIQVNIHSDWTNDGTKWVPSINEYPNSNVFNLNIQILIQNLMIILVYLNFLIL